MPTGTARIRAVLLDAGNTLFYESPSRFEIYAAAARDLGLGSTLSEVRAAMHRAHEMTPPLPGETARYTDCWFRAYVPAVYRDLGASESLLDGFLETLLERYRKTVTLQLFPETAEVLGSLRKRGVALAIVSNWSPRLLLHLERLELTNKFDAILVSAIEGMEKPSAGIFLRACERLGVSPGETLHVGDHPVNDVEGAQRAGIRGLLINRGAGAASDSNTIKSLREILYYIGDAA
ncbi:MAG: HAD-IA family hydrolase [Planctomycetes bacterium]|nr:HAD-IA family hydrolase [Planctomycetota bacterium]